MIINKFLFEPKKTKINQRILNMIQDALLLTKSLSYLKVCLPEIKQLNLLFDPIHLLLLLLRFRLTLNVLIDLLSKLDQLPLKSPLIVLHMLLNPLVHPLLQIHYKKIIKFI